MRSLIVSSCCKLPDQGDREAAPALAPRPRGGAPGGGLPRAQARGRQRLASAHARHVPRPLPRQARARAHRAVRRGRRATPAGRADRFREDFRARPAGRPPRRRPAAAPLARGPEAPGERARRRGRVDRKARQPRDDPPLGRRRRRGGGDRLRPLRN